MLLFGQSSLLLTWSFAKWVCLITDNEPGGSSSTASLVKSLSKTNLLHLLNKQHKVNHDDCETMSCSLKRHAFAALCTETILALSFIKLFFIIYLISNVATLLKNTQIGIFCPYGPALMYTSVMQYMRRGPTGAEKNQKRSSWIT